MGDGPLVDFPNRTRHPGARPRRPHHPHGVVPPGRFLLGNAQLPAPPAQPITLGEPLLYHAQVDSRTVRVALLEVDYGSSPPASACGVQVAQSLTVHERIARELFEQLLLPMA